MTENNEAPHIPVGLTQEEMDRVNHYVNMTNAARLPGEDHHWSAFRITFDDGCEYYGYTSNIIA